MYLSSPLRQLKNINTIIVQPSSPEPSIKDINTIPKKCMIIYHLISDILQTHLKLDINDIRFTSNIICNMNLSNNQLAKFLLHSYKFSNTGRFTLTFNYNLDIYIKIRNKEKIELLANMSENDAFIELYDNPLLTEIEKITISNIYRREYLSILNTIEYAIATDIPLNSIFPSNLNNLNNININDFINNENKSLYSKCYDGICYYELEKNGNIDDIIGGCEIPMLTYISDIDIQDNNTLNKVYCFDLMELIEMIANNYKINKFTNKIFNPRVYDMIKQKYNKEINMYKKYLSIVSSN